MGLVSNCFRYQWDTAEGSAHALLPSNWDSQRQWNKTLFEDGGSTVNQTAANPPGHYIPRVFNPPILAGEMSMRIDAGGDLAADLIPTRPMSIDMTGSGDLDATAALAVAMGIAMTGSGTLAASIVGLLNMSIDLEGSGDLAANLSGIASMAVDMLGSGDLDATIAAYGNMAIDIVVTGTGLTTANVGQAVWSAIAAANNDAGTMGAKLNSAASGGVDYGDMATAVRDELQAELLRIVELAKVHGLVVGTDLVVSATSRTAGDVVQSISEDAGTVTVTRAP